MSVLFLFPFCYCCWHLTQVWNTRFRRMPMAPVLFNQQTVKLRQLSTICRWCECYIRWKHVYRNTMDGDFHQNSIKHKIPCNCINWPWNVASHRNCRLLPQFSSLILNNNAFISRIALYWDRSLWLSCEIIANHFWPKSSEKNEEILTALSFI